MKNIIGTLTVIHKDSNERRFEISNIVCYS